MAKIVELLDTQTPQVMIEAKIIQATETFSRTLSGSMGLGSSNNPQYMASFSGGNPVDALLGGVFADGSAAATSAASGATFGFSPSFGLFGGTTRLNALLRIGEEESKLKVITAPKAVVLNKEKATITQTLPVAVPTIGTDANGRPVSLTEIKDAKIELNVEASVTNDEAVLMNFDILRDTAESAAAVSGTSAVGIGKRNVKSKVLVENGSTLVIGGVYIADTTETESGLPGLRKVPIIGWLFGSESKRTQRSELFIFVTPKILNRSCAGFTTQ
jgi:type IV pilus assembly protein PilQ